MNTRSRADRETMLRTGSVGEMVVVLWLATVSLTSAHCIGDCNDNGSVAIDELVKGVEMALVRRSVSDCPALDIDSDGRVAIAELIAAVKAALTGCPQLPTSTATASATPSPSPTVRTGFKIDGCVNEFPGEPCGAN